MFSRKSVCSWLLGVGLLGVGMFVCFPAFAQWDPNLGWDFQDHTVDHAKLSELTPDEMRAEFEQVNADFLSHGMQIPEHLSYPHGDYDDVVKAVTAEYRYSGRVVWGFMDEFPMPDWYVLKAGQLKRTTAWNRIKGWVDDAIATNALLQIFTHEVSDTASVYGTTPEKLAQLLDYLVEKQNAGLLQVVTVGEAYDYWSTASAGKAMVVVGFDDGYATDYTTVYPMFQARGLKGTSYITTDFVGQSGYLTWDMIAQMQDAGPPPDPQPDLSVTAADIAFSPTQPAEGELVTVDALVRNTGDADASNVSVDFYDGLPDSANWIGSDLIDGISIGGSATATTTLTVWGSHQVYVVVDGLDAIAESNEANNQASATISVATGNALHVASIDIVTSAQGPFVTAHASVAIVDELGQPVAGALVVGDWSGVASGTVSETTDTAGVAVLTSDRVKNGGVFVFTVTDVVLDGWLYDSAANVETSDSGV